MRQVVGTRRGLIRVRVRVRVRGRVGVRVRVRVRLHRWIEFNNDDMMMIGS